MRTRRSPIALGGAALLAAGLMPWPVAAARDTGVPDATPKAVVASTSSNAAQRAADTSGRDRPLRRHADGVVLVGFQPWATASSRRQARASVDAGSHRALSPLATDVERLTLPAGLSVDAAVAALRRNPTVRFVEPDYVRTVDAVPDDPGFTTGLLWGLYTTSGTPPATSAYGIRAAVPWAAGLFGNQAVHVGVIDTGIDVSHPDLAPNVWTNPFETPGNGVDDDDNGYVDDIHGWDFFHDDASVFDDPSLDHHGTHVAGTIGAAGGNGAGMVGVNWTVTLISLKFIEGVGFDSDAVAAIDYLTDLKTRHGLDIPVSNNSWGGPDAGTAVRDAIARAADEDILFVAAAGNAGVSLETLPFYPAAWTCTNRFDTGAPRGYDCILSVAAIDSAGNKPGYSNYGATAVDLGAPGSGIASTWPGKQYAYSNGTSMAAPHVTGAIALLAGCQAAPTPQALRGTIIATATPTSSLSGITVTGDRLDVSTFAGLCDDPSPRAVVSVAPALVTTTSRTYTAWFSEPVTGLAADDLAIGGTSSGWSVGSVTGSGAGPYSITLTTDALDDGTLALTLDADAVTGASGDGPAVPFRAATLTIDAAKPTATVTRPASPTKATILGFAVTFSEPVTGLAGNDFLLGGTATGCSVGAPSGSGASYTVNVTGCSAGTLALTLKANGVQDVAGNGGPAGPVASGSVTIDRTAPTTGNPSASLRTGVSASGADIPIRIAWSGSDTGGAGIVRYELQRSNDGGTTWSVVSSGITGTSWSTMTGTTGTRKFRLRAVDAAGNVGAWVAGPTFSPRLVQQTATAISYSGTWSTSTSSSYSGGSVRYAGVAGRAATYTFSGRAVALVTTLGPARGAVRIYVDGVLQTTIDLGAPAWTYRRLVYAKGWGSKGSHTIRIVVVGTAGRSRIDLDAFAVFQ